MSCAIRRGKDSIVCCVVHCLHCNAWLSSPLKSEVLFTLKSMFPLGSCCCCGSWYLTDTLRTCVMKLHSVVSLMHLLSKKTGAWNYRITFFFRVFTVVQLTQKSFFMRWVKIVDVWSIFCSCGSKTKFSENLLTTHLFLILVCHSAMVAV